MIKSTAEEKMAMIPPARRILLLSHCLRRSQTCQGKYSKWGLECVSCNPNCPVNRLKEAATRLGYKGVCIAPGGKLAVNYVRETRPDGIVAVACQTELEEGVHGVKDMEEFGDSAPEILIIPLTKDGCVDTEVDERQAMEMISLGCKPEPSPGQ